MTDGEVLQWLSEEERALWRWAPGTDRERAQILMPIIDALRSLAETRKALAGVVDREYATDGPCAVCELHRYEDHAPGCLYATMPRPPTGTTEDKQSARARADVQERED
jgi:hypothetical protein